jgi:hypothetical protein
MQAVLISDKRVQAKIRRDKRDHCILIKGIISQEAIMVISICTKC